MDLLELLKRIKVTKAKQKTLKRLTKYNI